MKSASVLVFFGLFIGASLVSGCGGQKAKTPALIPVTGIVTLNGQPLPHASVAFHPVAEGGSSYGRTNEKGEYSLKYTDNDIGAIQGEHRVEITTKEEIISPEGTLVSESPERLPPKYHSRTTLNAQVSKENATFNFDLKSK